MSLRIFRNLIQSLRIFRTESPCQTIDTSSNMPIEAFCVASPSSMKHFENENDQLQRSNISSHACCPRAIYDSITWLGQSEIKSHRPIYIDPEIGTQESVSEIFEHHTYSPQKTQRYGYEFIVYLCLLVKIDGLHICISERLSEPSVNLFIQPAQNKESFSAKLVALHFTPVSRSVEG